MPASPSPSVPGTPAPRVFGAGSTVLWLIGESELPFSGPLPEDTALVACPAADWNRDLSPWPAPAAFRGQPFSGQADAFLSSLLGDVMSSVLSEHGLMPKRQGILGYSLAGLFSLYALCRTECFQLAASVSGSLWFDGFIPWLREHPPKIPPKRIYLSVGDREKNTRNPRMSRVENCTREAADFLSARCEDVSFCLEQGGHFDEPGERVYRAVRYLAGP